MDELTNIDVDPSQIYVQYDIPQIVNISTTTITGSTTVVTTINGNSGQATGPAITITGGSTGLTFAATGNAITLSGTLIAANGGTGQSSYTKGDLLAASAATTLSKLAAAANGARLTTDSTQTTGLIWTAASTGWSNATGTAARTALASYAGQTVSNPPTQAEVQQIDDAVKAISQHLVALLNDLFTQIIIKA